MVAVEESAEFAEGKPCPKAKSSEIMKLTKKEAAIKIEAQKIRRKLVADWKKDCSGNALENYLNSDAVRCFDCCGLEEIISPREGNVAADAAILMAISHKPVELSAGLLVATSIQSQKGYATALKIAGFSKKSVFYNPNSGNTVTLWVKKINQPTRK